MGGKNFTWKKIFPLFSIIKNRQQKNTRKTELINDKVREKWGKSLSTRATSSEKGIRVFFCLNFALSLTRSLCRFFHQVKLAFSFLGHWGSFNDFDFPTSICGNTWYWAHWKLSVYRRTHIERQTNVFIRIWFVCECV